MCTSNPPKALLFDVFGTVVNDQQTITDALSTAASQALNSPSASIASAVRLQASNTSWSTIAEEWNQAYTHLAKTYSPTTPFVTVDDFLPTSLAELLERHQLTGLWTPDEIRSLVRIWHFLDPWPDAVQGLTALKTRFSICALSNGNISLLSDMAGHAHLPWTRIFSAEHFHAYKPSPLVYDGAARELGFRANECALVAAHLGDLKGARACGFQTVYVEREDQERWPQEAADQAKKEKWVDMWVGLGLGEGGFLEVARRFGIGIEPA